jgi:hypothetical protein
MTCRVAVRASSEVKLDDREMQIADMKTLLEKGKQQVARSQTLIGEIGQRLQPLATV